MWKNIYLQTGIISAITLVIMVGVLFWSQAIL